jgi:hypothetical protein
MFYTVYQIVNKINGKVYVGKHITNNLYDDYMGSGKLICRAIKKYGHDCFYKTIVGVYDNESLMNAAEKFMVAYDPDTTYNLCEGGRGGWGYVNRTGLNVSKTQKNIARNLLKKDTLRVKFSKKLIVRWH